MSCHSELSVSSSEGGGGDSPYSNGEILTNGEEAEMEVEEEGGRRRESTAEEEVVEEERNPIDTEKILAFGRDLQSLLTRLSPGHSSDHLKTLLQVRESLVLCTSRASSTSSECSRTPSVSWPTLTPTPVQLGISWTPFRENQSVQRSTRPYSVCLSLWVTGGEIISLPLFPRSESKNLPGQPPLEFALGQAVQCLRHMSRNGLGSAAFTGVQDIVSS